MHNKGGEKSMQELKLSYESAGMSNYLCTEVTEQLSKYQVKMLECNDIPGILSLHTTTINGVCKLRYNITKMYRLSDVLRSGVDRNRAKKLLLDILKTILVTEDYFLSFTRCFLDPDYIFLQLDDTIGLVYLPYQEEEVTSVNTIREFYQTLLVDYLTEENDVFFLTLLKYVNRSNFSIIGLMEKLDENSGNTSNVNVKIKEKKEDVQNVHNEKEEYDSIPVTVEVKSKGILSSLQKETSQKAAKAEKQEEKPENANLGFSVPGMGNVSIPEVSTKSKDNGKKEKETPEKKGGIFSSKFFGGKKGTEEKASKVEKTQKSQSQKLEKNHMSFATPSVKSSMSQEDFSYQRPQEENQWSGTVMLEEETSRTEILTEDSASLVHRGKYISLNNFPFKIGNGKLPGMHYVIPNGTISKNHASILCSGGRYYIKDENSSNHTYVNGKQIPPYTEVELFSGTVIRLANEELTFQL